MIKQVVIHSDGSCWPNPGPGGWAAVIQWPGERHEIKGASDGTTTNNRMEITAAIKALEFLKEAASVDLYTDSEYLKLGASIWIDRWSRKNWKGVKNSDLWRQISMLQFKHDIRWHWVRGHADCAENNRADLLAETMRIAKSEQPLSMNQ